MSEKLSSKLYLHLDTALDAFANDNLERKEEGLHCPSESLDSIISGILNFAAGRIGGLHLIAMDTIKEHKSEQEITDLTEAAVKNLANYFTDSLHKALARTEAVKEE